LPELRTQEKFDPAKVEIKRDLRSVTQGSTSIHYDGKLLASYGDDPQLQPGGKYEQRPDSYWMGIAKDVFTGGDPRNSISSRAGGFRSGHFDEPNVLAHIRFNDRTDADGNKILYSSKSCNRTGTRRDESKGYRDPEKIAALEDERRALIEAEDKSPVPQDMQQLGDELRRIEKSGGAGSLRAQAIRRLLVKKGYTTMYGGGRPDGEFTVERRPPDRLQEIVPDAPFKKTWHELALKRMLRYAAENGYDKLGWTPGDVQNDRYDLSKHVSEVRAYPQEMEPTTYRPGP
jgi:hypothetical protein